MYTAKPVGAKLAREEARTSSIFIGYDNRHREQARSHIGSSTDTESMYTAKPVGAKLAREEASTSSIFIGYDTAIASKPNSHVTDS